MRNFILILQTRALKLDRVSKIIVYRTLTRFWPLRRRFWPPCIKKGCLSLAEMGSEFVYLANFSAHCTSQG